MAEAGYPITNPNPPTGGGQETKVAPLSHVVAFKSRAEVSFRELIGDETDLRIQPCNRE